MSPLKQFGAILFAVAIGVTVATECRAGAIESSDLTNLVRAASQANTDALVITKDGNLVGEWYFNRKQGQIEAMSMTKSIVSLAIGRLITEKKLLSIDEPIWKFYPEWRQGMKEKITIRHLLSHTSGIQDDPSVREIYRSPDFVKLALCAELSDPPGQRFAYNNKAVNILSGIVEKTSGEKLDRYVESQIFTPLGIKDFSWHHDLVGNAMALSGLQIKARDLAKIGELLLQNGNWQGTQIISDVYLREMVTPSQTMEPTCGLLWWIVPSNPSGYAARGHLGQYLQIFPQSHTVIVRQIRSTSHKSAKDDFVDFTKYAQKLVSH